MSRLNRIFGFLRSYKGCSINFRTKELDYSKYKTEDRDWKHIYGDIQKEIPNNMPKAKGRKVTLTMFADANLYHDQITRCSMTGLSMMLIKTPIAWFSKKQLSVESAIYGSEFVAARIGTDKLVET